MIGYYIHHQGDGHVTRAGAIARALGDEPVTGLSSRARPDDWPGLWVRLARDDDPAPGPFDDVTAGGALHWAPPGHPGLRERMAQLAAWVAAYQPRLMVVDVSVEVTVLLRSMGVPVTVMALPGRRDDPAHQLAYQLADAILAPWPEWADLLGGGDPWRAKTRAVGPISRFEGRPRPDGAFGPAAPAHAAGERDAPPRGRRVLVLSGRGGTELTAAALAAAQAQTPDWTWTVLGPPGDRWVADPWPLLCAADVIVTHAGQNAIADVAAARRPAIVVPQDRPHAEQATTARALEAAGLAVVAHRWPGSGWAERLERAVALGGAGWARWSAPGAAERAAAVLRDLAGAPR